MPSAPSHVRAVLSSEAVAIVFPSLAIATPRTASPWPARVCKVLPEATSKTRADLSVDPVTSRAPSGVTDRALIARECPSNVRTAAGAHETDSGPRMARDLPPVAKATALVPALPGRDCSSRAPAVSQTRVVPSSEAEANREPSGERARAVTGPSWEATAGFWPGRKDVDPQAVLAAEPLTRMFPSRALANATTASA